MSAAGTKPPCRANCGRRAVRAGQLCERCYEDPANREKYPPIPREERQKTEPLPKMVRLEDITFDAALQMRAGGVDAAAREEYTEAYKNGDKLPPLVGFADEETDTLWCADGFTRGEAADDAGLEEVPMIVHKGSRWDAMLYAAGANHQHGKQRTNEDKRKAVLTLFADPVCSTWTNNKIANVCNVSHTFVDNLEKKHPKAAPPGAGSCNVATSEETLTNGDGGQESTEPTAATGGTSSNGAASRNGTGPGKPAGKKKADPPAVKDKLGNDLPNGVADIFGDKAYGEVLADCEKAVEALTAVKKGLDRLKARHAHFPFLHWEGLFATFDHAYDLDGLPGTLEVLRNGEPYARCPYCAGTLSVEGKPCQECRRVGYVSRSRWEEIQREKGEAA